MRRVPEAAVCLALAALANAGRARLADARVETGGMSALDVVKIIVWAAVWWEIFTLLDRLGPGT
jgi:hypothetical protein